MATLAESSITAQALITHAHKLIQNIEPGQSPTTDETADALIELNMILDAWRNEGLLCYAKKVEAFTLVPGTSLYTIGTSGTFVTDRPVKIDAAYCTYLAYSRDIEVINELEYAGIVNKTNSSDYPTTLFYSAAVPNGNIYLNPVPSIASTLSLVTWTPHLLFATAATAVFFPPGWQTALTSQLAINISPNYGREASASVVARLRSAKSGIIKANARPLRAYVYLPVTNRNGYNVRTDR